eukprot:Colp12_sorted_trinity150504_noHs@32464
MEREIETALDALKKIQSDTQKLITARAQLEAQLTENQMVAEEVNLLEADANIFKMIGPVLVKQDRQEAKDNIKKRIDFISGELKRYEKEIKASETKQEEARNKVIQLQQAYQAQMQKAAAK